MAQSEITVQVFEDFDKVVNKLQSIGYVWKDTFTGMDQYFTTIDDVQVNNASYKQLLDSSIIIREFDKKSTGEHKVSMVHKKKTLDEQGRVIGEIKSNAVVDNSQDTAKVLSSAGLNNWMTLNQQNSFYVNGEKTIIVGTVQGLDGVFIEIEEYPSIADKPEQEKFEILRNFVDSFGFKMGDDYSCKKIYMLYQKQLARA